MSPPPGFEVRKARRLRRWIGSGETISAGHRETPVRGRLRRPDALPRPAGHRTSAPRQPRPSRRFRHGRDGRPSGTRRLPGRDFDAEHHHAQAARPGEPAPGHAAQRRASTKGRSISPVRRTCSASFAPSAAAPRSGAPARSSTRRRARQLRPDDARHRQRRQLLPGGRSCGPDPGPRPSRTRRTTWIVIEDDLTERLVVKASWLTIAAARTGLDSALTGVTHVEWSTDGSTVTSRLAATAVTLESAADLTTYARKGASTRRRHRS